MQKTPVHGSPVREGDDARAVMLDAVEAQFMSPADYPEISISASPGHIYVINDLRGQLVTSVEFVVDIVGPQDGFSKRIRVDAQIGFMNYLPIFVPQTALDRFGQLRNFTFAAAPGGIAGQEQSVGEFGKTYSWHVLWLHNSLRNP